MKKVNLPDSISRRRLPHSEIQKSRDKIEVPHQTQQLKILINMIMNNSADKFIISVMLNPDENRVRNNEQNEPFEHQVLESA